MYNKDNDVSVKTTFVTHLIYVKQERLLTFDPYIKIMTSTQKIEFMINGDAMYDYDRLNELFVTTLKNINDTEEKTLITDEFKDITINDMHILEAIGQKNPQNMSSVAAKLNETVGTLTIAINHLVKKGYVLRQRGEQDRRVVFLSLSEKGNQAFQKHIEFHKSMTLNITQDLSEKELELLVQALKKISVICDPDSDNGYVKK